MNRSPFPPPRRCDNETFSGLPLVVGYALPLNMLSRSPDDMFAGKLRYMYAAGALDGVELSLAKALIQHEEFTDVGLPGINLKLHVDDLGLLVRLAPHGEAGAKLVRAIRNGFNEMSQGITYRRRHEQVETFGGERVAVITKIDTLDEVSFVKRGKFPTTCRVVSPQEAANANQSLRAPMAERHAAIGRYVPGEYRVRGLLEHSASGE